MAATIEYCGEAIDLPEDRAFTIGRDADLVVDENQFLHRRFLQIDLTDNFWWLSNVGSQLSATMSDADGFVQAWLAPGARVPIVFPNVSIRFTAGPTTYELTVALDSAPFRGPSVEDFQVASTTTGRAALTPEQRLLLLAIAEPMLRSGPGSRVEIPASKEVANRLGWPLTKLNRKLDAVCEKLGRTGVPGLHGGPSDLAANRRARLVEYALATRMVRVEELVLLDAPAGGPGEGASVGDHADGSAETSSTGGVHP